MNESMIGVIIGEPTKEQFEYFNRYADAYYDKVQNITLSELENDVQKQIFMDWWHGKSLYKWNEIKKDHDRADAYKFVSKYDWDEAHDYILWACGQGCG